MREGHSIKKIELGGAFFQFRYSRWSDAPAYVDMCNILHREQVMAYHAATDFSLGIERLSRFLLGLEKGTLAHVVIETDGQIVGEGCIQTGTAPKTGTLGVKITGACRRRGLGAQMMFILEDEARKLGLARIYLVVWGLNEAAHRLYLKVGYREVGRIPEWFAKEDEQGHLIWSDRVDMIKELGKAKAASTTKSRGL